MIADGDVVGEPGRRRVETRDPVVAVIHRGHVGHGQADGAIAEYAAAAESDHRQLANRIAAYSLEDLAGRPDLLPHDADSGLSEGHSADVVRCMPRRLDHGTARA